MKKGLSGEGSLRVFRLDFIEKKKSEVSGGWKTCLGALDWE